MADGKKSKVLAPLVAIFVVYSIGAARPVPPETTLVPLWLSSLEQGETQRFKEPESQAVPDGRVLPFTLGSRFGYFTQDGSLALNRVMEGSISISGDKFSQFGPQPLSVTVSGTDGEPLGVIDNPGGYPFFLDGKTFIMGRDQYTVSRVGNSGSVLWTFDFPGTVTVVAASSGLFLAGLLDGTAVLLDGSGKQVFSFEPGGSRIPVIMGAAISADGSRLAVVSGVDSQRFLLYEKFGAGSVDYRPVYHESLGDGLRRPVRVEFTGNGRNVIFERSDGLGVYDTAMRLTRSVEIEGSLRSLDSSGADGMVFAVFATEDGAQDNEASGERLDIFGISISGRVPALVMRSTFRSHDVFLGRAGSSLVVGGGQVLAAFGLEKR